MTPTLIYLGPQGTHTHQAAQIHTTKITPNIIHKLRPYPNIPDIMEAIATGEVESGIVPVENSIAGTVNITVDLLIHEFNLAIQEEIVLDITHHLLTFMPNLTDIHTLFSHDQALAQCRHFLKKYLPHATICKKESTAEAVRFLREKEPQGTAAIGSFASHQYYQVPLKKQNIGDYPHNQTRFFLLGKNLPQHPDPQKTSLIIFPRNNQPGQLCAILEVFAEHNLNLSKVESRPSKTRLGNYLFLIDYESPLTASALPEVFQALDRATAFYKYLGSYPVYYFPEK